MFPALFWDIAHIFTVFTLNMLAQKSVNLLLKCTLKYVRNFFIVEFIKIIRNEILHVQYTTHSVMVLLYKLTGRFKSEPSR
jgi:hypothetical protein